MPSPSLALFSVHVVFFPHLMVFTVFSSWGLVLFIISDRLSVLVSSRVEHEFTVKRYFTYITNIVFLEYEGNYKNYSLLHFPA